MGKSSSIEIDVSLNMDGIQKDFNELEKKAKTGTRSVVKAVDQIATSMEETGTGAKKAGQEYEKAAEGMEESAKDAAKGTDDLQESVEKTADSTDGLKESEDKLSRQSKKTGEDQEDLGDKTEETRQKVEKSRESFLNWGEIAQTAVKGVVVVAGTLFSAMGAGAGMATSFGTAYKQASNNIQASTGATKEEMESLKNVMANVYANNFGEDMNDVADAVANVKKNIGGTDQEIQKATEAAFAFRDTFGYEIPESSRAAKAMMDNFGISAEKAYDLMAKGAQNGLDYSGELIDNINEYSVQFGKAGLSAEDMFNIMAAGADAGAWNLDKIGDAVKELNIRLVDGSDTTKEGLKAIGMNADEVAKKMSEGGETARETYQKVVKGLAEMDDKQQQNIAGVNLFGTMWEDLGPEVVAHLADLDGAYSDVKGTMDEINEVKYDDAKSALEALKRKAEVSLLLPISEDIMPAISNATKAATGYIDELASAYDSNGVNGLVEKAGEIFSDIATNAAEQAPRMVDVAVSFIEETAAGFQKNSGKLVKAGSDLVKSIAGAAVKALPKELQEPVENAVDDLVDSLTGGGIKNGLKTFGKMFENGFSAVTKVTKTVLPPFVKMIDTTADNMDVLIPLVVAGATAFKGYSIINSVTSGLKGLTAVTATLTAMEQANALQIAAATGALTAKEMAVGVLTGKVTLATAATTVWNAVLNANPIALLTTGVVAAAAAIAAYCLISDDGTEKTGQLSEAEQELKDRVEEQAEAYRKLQEEREEQFAKINTEFSNTQALADELQTIVDKNGKIKESYEDRAAVIVGLLNEALGTEIEITDGVIQKYDELKTTIDEVILSKKAEAVQSTMQDDYAEAINNQTQAYMDYAQAQKNVEDTTKKLEAAQKKQKEIQDKIDTSSSRAAFATYGRELQNAKADVEALEKKQKDQQKTLQDSEETYVGYVSTIQNYEGVVGAIASGDAEKINQAVLLATNSFIDAEVGTKESLERQVENLKANYEAMKKAVETGAPGVTQKSVDEMKALVDRSEAELAKFKEKAKKQGEAGGDAYAVSIASKASMAGQSGRSLATSANVGMGAINASLIGVNIGSQYASGISSKKTDANIAANAVAMAARAGASVDGSDLGRNFGQGFANGIASTVRAAAQAAANIAANALAAAQKTIDSHSPSKETDKLGKYFGQGFVNGIVRLTAEAAEAAGQMGKQSIEAFQRNLQTDGLEFDVEAAIRRVDDAVQSRVESYAAPKCIVTEEKASSDDFKKKADYLISGFKKIVKEQGDTVICWKDREIGRMFREVLE